MTTPRLGAPELVASQAIPEMTVNEQLRYAEQGASLWIVKDKDLATPPGSPTDGDAYIVAASPTGAWTGWAGRLAFRMSTSWEDVTPIEGVFAWIQDENKLYYYNGSAWGEYTAGAAGGLLAANNLSDVADIPTALRNLFAADVSPSQITANQNDYNPASLATATVLRLSSDASRNITGLQGGADGRVLVVANVGANDIVLKDESGSSSAANRFALDADLTLAADTSAVIIYDATSSRWRLIARGRASTAGVTFASAAEYRTGTEAAKALAPDQVWAAADYVPLTDAATIAVDMSTGFNFSVTLGGNRTLGNPTNTKNGQTGLIVITQDGTGTRTLAYGTNWEFASATAPVLTTTAGAKDLLFYQVISSTSIYATLIKAVS